MGSAASKEKINSQQRFLIGKLENKSDLERRFYRLSYLCLSNTQILLSNSTEQTAQLESVPTDGDGQARSVCVITGDEDKGAEDIKVVYMYDDKESMASGRELGGNSKTETGRLKSPDSSTPSENRLATGTLHIHSGMSDMPTSDQALFTPILGSTKLLCAQTYVSWRSAMDLERLKSVFFDKRTIYLTQVDRLPDFLTNFRMIFDSEEITLFDLAQKFLTAFFTGMKVTWTKPVYISEQKWRITSRHHEKTGKFQYLVTDFFTLLPTVCPKDGYCILGLIWSDLYPKQELNFVLGEAHNKYKSGMVSFGRFEPKSYEEKTTQDVSSVTSEVVWKLLKCLSHELCHLFGMSHCDFFQCTMNGSGSVAEAMSQPTFLCPVCVRKLQHICKFDIIERYERLEQVLKELVREFPSENWKKSLLWIQKCLNCLTTTVTHL